MAGIFINTSYLTRTDPQALSGAQGTTSYAKCLAKRHIESRLVQQANLGACVAERREDWFQQLFPAR